MSSSLKEAIELNAENIEALVKRLKERDLTDADFDLLSKIVPLFASLAFALREARISVGRLKEMIFGPGKKNKNTSDHQNHPGEGKDSPGDDDPHGGDACTNGGQETALMLPTSKPTPPGHGRYGADTYTGAVTVKRDLEVLRVGDQCPNGPCGFLNPMPRSIKIWVDSAALLNAIRFELERLRCSGCQEIFVAPLPDNVGPGKYSVHAQVTVAMNRYFLGVPFHRQDALQAMLGVPVADATQFDLVDKVAQTLKPVFDQLCFQAAQSQLIYQDDTGVRILSLIRENHQSNPKRKGMFTTGIDGKRR